MDDVVWEPPGPGSWELDLAHCLGSMTPIVQHVLSTGLTGGMRQVFADYGMPADALEARFVNGYLYTRLRPLLGANSSSTRLPPRPVLKAVFTLHPEFRRRRKRAEWTLANKPWRAAVRHWEEVERGELEAENLALQDVDPGALNDAGLARHYEDVFDATMRGVHRHFVLHGFDLGPIGLLLVACQGWGISGAEVAPALRGASPATSEPARILTRLREAVAESGAEPASLDEVRAISPEVAAELDHYLRYRGLQIFTRYDIDGITLGELPGVVLSSILAGREAPEVGSPDEVAARIRAKVPEADRAEFDDLLTEARFAMNLRDDNGPTTAEWRLGLIRRVLLEAGRRLALGGRLAEPEHAFELAPDEVAPLIAESRGPSAAELAARAERRAHLSTLAPPATLGPDAPLPPLDLLPSAQARLLAVVEALMVLMARAEHDDGLTGTGVGTESYRGPVRKAGSPEAAIAALEPGDVLVVPFTTPAYNSVLPLAGAVVTVHGGLLCHAAVLARELGLPAVVGAAAAFDRLEDGMEVEVDPVAGTVRLVDVPAPAAAPV
jgi:rifampicin phosphotransferase